MIRLSFKAAKAGFFDRDAVLKAVGKARVRILGESGRLVRKHAQKSLVYATGAAAGPQQRDAAGRFLKVGRTSAVSRPGNPPFAHKSGFRTKTSKKTGRTRTRRVSYLREFLYYSYDKQSQSVVVGPVRLNSTVDPGSLAALERGGPSTILDHGKRRTVGIRARPFMGPALAAEQPALEALWRDSVR